MNKTLRIVGLVAVVVLAIGAVTAFAQDTAPDPTLQAPAGSFGQGRGMGLAEPDAMHAAIADALGMTAEEFETAIAGGETLVTLAQAQGVDIETVWDAMQAVREDALEQAVADGLITEAQAAQVRERWAQMPGPGFGPGFGPCQGDGPIGGPGTGMGPGHGIGNSTPGGPGMGGSGMGGHGGHGQGMHWSAPATDA